LRFLEIRPAGFHNGTKAEWALRAATVAVRIPAGETPRKESTGTGQITDVDSVRFPEENLWVFPTDNDNPAGVLNNEIDQTFVPKAEVSPPASGKFDSWRENLVAVLRSLSFRTFPERIPPADKAPRYRPWRDPGGI
jgi:hypothetical protein